MWTTEEAIALARFVESIAPQYGAHVALSGGLLYKDGERKDCDLVLYRHRQAAFLDKSGLLEALRKAAREAADLEYEPHPFYVATDYGFCVKASWHGKDVDLLFPEVHPSAVYPDGENSEDAAAWDDSVTWETLVR